MEVMAKVKINSITLSFCITLTVKLGTNVKGITRKLSNIDFMQEWLM